MVDDSGGKPPPIIHYLSSVYVMRGGYFPYLELMGCFVFFTIIDVIKNVYPIFEILFYYLYPCDEPNDFVLSIFIFMERVKNYCKCFVFLQSITIFASYNLKIFIN